MAIYEGNYQSYIDNHAYETEEELAELRALRDEEWEDAMYELCIEERMRNENSK